MIYISWLTTITVIGVLTFQFINIKKYWDGNGQMKTRVLFIIQVVCMGIISVCDIGRWPHMSALPVFILALNSLCFYLGTKWDVSTPLFWLLKRLKK